VLWKIFADRPAVVALLAPCALSLLLTGLSAQAEEGDAFGYSTLEGVTVTATSPMSITGNTCRCCKRPVATSRRRFPTCSDPAAELEKS
jgi:hypothetical protein